MTKKSALQAIAILVGTIIGAGILGIPYVVAQAGFFTGIATIIVLGIVVLLLYLYMGEIVLRTKGFHQLTGYAQRYLGKWGRRLMTFTMVFGIYGALIAYIMGEGQALAAIFGGAPILYSLIFFIVVSIIIYIGIKAVGESELWMVLVTIGIVIILALLSSPFIATKNFTSFNPAKIFIPYGVVFFALLGAAAIPEMKEELVRNEKKLKRSIIIGASIPIIIYLIFTFIVVGVTGLQTTEVATIGLGEIIGSRVILIGNLFAVLTMATSFLTLGLALKEMYNYDYKINHFMSWGLTCFIPLAIALSNVTTFIKAIGIAGVVAGGIEGILIVLMAFRAKKLGNRKPEYSVKLNKLVAALIIAIFILGAIFYFRPL
ncbi:GerAB/ArcD/ProY family transporter [Candidatus Woesearchaeota archaeon]|nr:GerAB/ArcD/ProY family transporter [Candidatus Woesearchaeota archaeon]